MIILKWTLCTFFAVSAVLILRGARFTTPSIFGRRYTFIYDNGRLHRFFGVLVCLFFALVLAGCSHGYARAVIGGSLGVRSRSAGQTA